LRRRGRVAGAHDPGRSRAAHARLLAFRRPRRHAALGRACAGAARYRGACDRAAPPAWRSLWVCDKAVNPGLQHAREMPALWRASRLALAQSLPPRAAIEGREPGSFGLRGTAADVTGEQVAVANAQRQLAVRPALQALFAPVRQARRRELAARPSFLDDQIDQRAEARGILVR